MVHQAVLWFQLLTNEWKCKKKKSVCCTFKDNSKKFLQQIKADIPSFCVKDKKKKKKSDYKRHKLKSWWFSNQHP